MAVHPRVCGEQLGSVALLLNVSGSSPRVRGTERVSPAQVYLKRFIPACAGNSEVQARDCLDTSVHPRVCGEQGRETQ